MMRLWLNIFILSSFCTIFFVVLLFTLESEPFIGKFRELEYYKYLERDYEKDEILIGIVSYPTNIDRASENSFLSYEFSTKKRVLISPFGEEEYECRGTCFCDNELWRRSSIEGRKISQVFVYLLSAASLVLANNIANNHFSESCQELLSEECQSDLIRSEVDDCEPLMHSLEENIEVTSEEILKKEQVKWDNEKGDLSIYFFDREYFCIGHCVESKRITSRKAVELMKEVGCNDIRTGSSLVIRESDLVSFKGHVSDRYKSTAAYIFFKDYLNPFCRERSQRKYLYEYKNPRVVAGREYKRSRTVTVKLCHGTRRVVCRQTDPKPRQWDGWKEKKKLKN